MSEMILPLGDYETRDGKFDAKVVANSLSGAFAILAVLTSRKTGHSSYALYTMDGHYLSTGHDNYLDLVPLKPAPVMGPLDANDIIPGVTLLRHHEWPRPTSALVVYRSAATVSIVIERGISLMFDALRRDYEYSNDHGKTWHKCEKEIRHD